MDGCGHQKTTYVVVGGGKGNASIVKSVPNEDRVICMTDSANALAFDDSLKNKLSELVKRYGDNAFRVVVNTGDDGKNALLAGQIYDLLLEFEGDLTENSNGFDLTAAVFSQEKGELSELVRRTYGRIRCINANELFARDFVFQHPLTQFMSDGQLDHETATVYPDVSINVILLGFDGINRSIFDASVATNQFLTKTHDGVKEKQVNYFIYGKRPSVDVNGTDGGYFRYAALYGELASDADKYLPLPEKPANEEFLGYELLGDEFFNSIKAQLSKKCSSNRIIIARGGENAELARLIVKKIREWEFEENTKIFVYTGGELLPDEEDKGYIPFGNEDETVYNVDRIFCDEFESMAVKRHLCYWAECGEEDALTARRRMYASERVQRESNLYACISIRAKLQLLGFDMTKDKNARDVWREYLKRYEANDKITYVSDAQNGKRAVDYGDCEFKRYTVRNILAMHEHQRWNAYEICNGYIPASIDDIKTKSKMQIIREGRHRNITTYDGMLAYRDMIAELNGISKREADIIKYDYQLMDDVVWLLARSGYKIVYKRED